MRDVIVNGLDDSFVSMLQGAIALGVKCGGHLDLHACKLVEGSPEARDEKLVVVADDLQWETVLAETVIEELYSKLLRRDIGRGWDEADV